MKKARKVRSKPILPKGLQNLMVLQIFLFLRALVWLAAHLPEKRTRFLIRTIYPPSAGFIRRVCHRNLIAFFPSLACDTARLKQLHRAYLDYMVRFCHESARCGFNSAQEIEDRVWLRGEEHLQETLRKGHGAMVVSGHMGTWWHIPCVLARRGHKVNVVFNSFPFPMIERYLVRHAARYGIQLAFVDRGIPRMIRRAARDNEVVYLTFDVAVRSRHSNWLPFGATKININPGPAILALRYGIPVLYGTTFHGDPNRSHIILHPEMVPDREKKDPNNMCRAWVERLHSEIVLHPEQWWGWGFSDLPCVRRHQAKELPAKLVTPDPGSSPSPNQQSAGATQLAKVA
jgi:Kdo2-lipid IVA lauroyltransferase/acyltransferase